MCVSKVSLSVLVASFCCGLVVVVVVRGPGSDATRIIEVGEEGNVEEDGSVLGQPFLEAGSAGSWKFLVR